ncbi:MAG: type II secretion system F family protein [Micrococcaceae bacterium]
MLSLWFLFTFAVVLFYIPPASWQKITPKVVKEKVTKKQNFSMASLLHEITSWLESGTNPQEVFSKLDPPQSITVYLDKVTHAISSQQSVDTALKENISFVQEELRPPFIQLSRAWKIAVESGCSLHDVLKETAAYFEDCEEQERHVKQALAAPQASAKVLLFLPLLSLGLSLAMGMVNLKTLLSSPFALISIIIGLFLNGVSYLWAHVMIKEVRP